MSEQLITTLIVAIGAPVLTLILNQWYQRHKNKIDYGSDVIDAMNKTAESLKNARAEIAQLDTQLRTLDQSHEKEIEDLQFQHKRERGRLRERISNLERRFLKYDVSFTMITHPDVRIENVKVIGTEDVLASQKLQAITAEQAAEDKEKRKK